MQIILYRIAIFILVAGLISAALIYFNADDIASDDAGYGSSSYLAPEDSKRAVHDMEQYGGKANVTVYKFGLWFQGLWHGKSLAYTTVFITLLLAFCFRLAADLVPSGSDPDK